MTNAIAELREIVSANMHRFDQFKPTPKESANFLINEIAGFCNGRGIPLTSVPPQMAVVLLTLRKMRAVTNMQIRAFLGAIVETEGN